MARSKRRNNRSASASVDNKTPLENDDLTLRDYVIMNAIFLAFCVAQLVIVRVMIKDFAGLYFFFGFIVCAFAIVSAYDYLATKMNVGVPSEENA